MHKLLIAIPTSRYIETECFQCLYEQKIPNCKTELFVPNSYSIDISRNTIAKYAMDNKFDYVFYLDSDIMLPKNGIKNLLSHDKDIVSGVYAYKQLGRNDVVLKRYTKDDPEDYDDLSVNEVIESKNRIISVDGFGFGCVLLKTEVFKNIKFPYFVYTQNLGEDIYFCQKAKLAGFELLVDTKVLCGHVGTVNYNIRG